MCHGGNVHGDRFGHFFPNFFLFGEPPPVGHFLDDPVSARCDLFNGEFLDLPARPLRGGRDEER